MIDKISAMTTGIPLAPEMIDEIKSFKLKEKYEERFFRGLEVQYRNYVDSYNLIAELGQEKALPLLKDMKENITLEHIESLFNLYYEINLALEKMTVSFVELVKGCDDISNYKLFMEHLGEHNEMLYEFVTAMKNSLIRRNKVKIDRKYTTFLKIYSDELFNNIDEKEIEKMAADLKECVDIIGNDFKSAEIPFMFTREKQRKINKIREISKRVNRLIVVPRDIDENLRSYVPSKILPMIILLEEAHQDSLNKIKKRKKELAQRAPVIDFG